MMDEGKVKYKEPSFLKSFISGGVGGVAILLVGHPMDTVKVSLVILSYLITYHYTIARLDCKQCPNHYQDSHQCIEEHFTVLTRHCRRRE